MSEKSFDIVLTDLRMPKGSGMDVLKWVTDNESNTLVLMMTAFATTENALEAMKGALMTLSNHLKLMSLNLFYTDQ